MEGGILEGRGGGIESSFGSRSRTTTKKKKKKWGGKKKKE